MQLKIFSIRDSKAETFNSPFYQPTHGEAERTFRTTVLDPKTVINQYPEDFDLWYLGEYNSNDGKITPLDTPQHMLKAVACMKPQNPQIASEDC